ncbi:MAG: hypothetical protein Fur0022_27070 [Anaerolineales bacterium]
MTPTSRYSHAQARRDIELQADGLLPSARQAHLETHLAACPDCRTYQQALFTLEKSLGELFQTHLPSVEYTHSENQVFAADVKASAHALRPLLQIPQWFNSLAWGVTLTLLMAGMAWVLANTRLEDRPPDTSLSLAITLDTPPGTYSTIPGDAPVNQVAFSPDSQLLGAAYNNGQVILWQTATQETYLTLEADPQRVSSLTFSSRDRLFTLGNGTLKVWQAGQLLQTITDIPGNPYRVGISATGAIQFLRHPNEFFLQTATSPWITPRGQAATPIILPTLAGEVVTASLSPDGNILATGSTSGNLYFWQISLENGQRQGTPLRMFKGHTAPITALVFHPHGDWIVSAAADGVFVWQASDGKLLYRLLEGESGVVSLAFAPNGSALAAALESGMIYLWLAEE